VSLLAMTASVFAVPSAMNYQGYLTDDNGRPVADGTYDIVFKICSDPDGIGEEWNSGTMSVQVEDGLFDVLLEGVSSSVFAPDLEYYLGIKVGLNPELRPLVRLATAPFAFKAKTTESVLNGAIDNLAVNVNANIDKSKIADTAITAVGSNNLHGHNSFYGLTSFHYGVNFYNYLNPSQGVRFYDSTMIVDDIGVRIGNYGETRAYSPLVIERHHDADGSSSRYGSMTYVLNAGTGMLCGTWSKGQRTTSSTTLKYTYGVYGSATNDFQIGSTHAVYGYATGGNDANAIQGYATGGKYYNWSGYFDGDVGVNGTIYKEKSAYRIDHPLYPEDEYLCHSSVASPDMKNVYDGVVTLNDKGSAVIILPEYFEMLNKDFRYQLTCIGSYAPVYIAEKIEKNQFEIAGGEPGMEISWQVTGIRKDPIAEDGRIAVEVEKFDHEKGLYIYPEGYGLGEEKSLNYESTRQAIEAAKGNGSTD